MQEIAHQTSRQLSTIRLPGSSLFQTFWTTHGGRLLCRSNKTPASQWSSGRVTKRPDTQPPRFPRHILGCTYSQRTLADVPALHAQQAMEGATDPANERFSKGNGPVYDPFFKAVREGTVADVEAALTDDIDINALRGDFSFAQTALHVAAEEGRAEIVQFLLDRGADINKLDRDGPDASQALHLAARHARPAVVKLLLDNGAERDRLGFDECDPLGMALYPTSYLVPITPERLETVKLLVDYGLDVNKSDALFSAVSLRDQSLIRYLLDHGGAINPVNPGDASLLTLAAGTTDYETVAFLLQNGAVVGNPIDGSSPGPLSAAADSGKLDIIKLLFSHADDETIRKSSLAVALAAGEGHLEVLKELLASGMNVGSRNVMDRTALHSACSSRTPRAEVIRFLLEKGADVQACDKSGNTPLHVHLSAFQQDPMVVRQLLEAGASVAARNRKGQTPLHTLARNLRCPNRFSPAHEIESPSIEALRLLLEAGADVNAEDAENQTTLHALAKVVGWLACKTGECAGEAARLLLEKGVKAEAVDVEHRTAADFAGKGKGSQSAKVLEGAIAEFTPRTTGE